MGSDSFLSFTTSTTGKPWAATLRILQTVTTGPPPTIWGMPQWLFILLWVVVGLCVLSVLIFGVMHHRKKHDAKLQAQLEMKMYRHEKKKAERATARLNHAKGQHEAAHRQPPPQPFYPPHQQPQLSYPQQQQSRGGDFYVQFQPADQYPMTTHYEPNVPVPPHGAGMYANTYHGGGAVAAPVHPFQFNDPYAMAGPPEGGGGGRKHHSRPPRRRSSSDIGRDDSSSDYNLRRVSSYSEMPDGPAPVPPPGFIAVPMVMDSGSRRSRSRHKR
eukprot:Selendium_serpulae@DN4110_c0_g1_i1.p1